VLLPAFLLIVGLTKGRALCSSVYFQGSHFKSLRSCTQHTQGSYTPAVRPSWGCQLCVSNGRPRAQDSLSTRSQPLASCGSGCATRHTRALHTRSELADRHDTQHCWSHVTDNVTRAEVIQIMFPAEKSR
jgi:hypothetical protein